MSGEEQIIQNADNENVITRLLQWMKFHNIKQYELESQLGIAKGYLSHQKKAGKNLEAETIIKLGENFPEMDFNWLIKGTTNHTDNSIHNSIGLSAHSCGKIGNHNTINYGECINKEKLKQAKEAAENEKQLRLRTEEINQLLKEKSDQQTKEIENLKKQIRELTRKNKSTN